MRRSKGSPGCKRENLRERLEVAVDMDDLGVVLLGAGRDEQVRDGDAMLALRPRVRAEP